MVCSDTTVFSYLLLAPVTGNSSCSPESSKISTHCHLYVQHSLTARLIAWPRPYTHWTSVLYLIQSLLSLRICSQRVVPLSNVSTRLVYFNRPILTSEFGKKMFLRCYTLELLTILHRTDFLLYNCHITAASPVSCDTSHAARRSSSQSD